MDDLDVNPLYKALLVKYKRQFEIACKMSYLVAIPRSDSLEGCAIDQHFANSHILVPSKLLKSHFNQLQVGDFEDIELDGGRLVCHFGRRRVRHPPEPLVVRVLAEEVGYNVHSKEYRTLLIDRPLVGPNAAQGDVQTRAIASFRTILAPLSPKSQLLAQLARKQRAQLISSRTLSHHDDCAKYLECVSQELTLDLEREVKQMQTNYMILAPYLEDAARRARSIIAKFVRQYELNLEVSSLAPDWPCETIRRSVRLSVENYVVYLLHGKLMTAIHKFYEKEDTKLQNKFELMSASRLSLCQLGAQSDFSHFELTDELTRKLRRLPSLQSPIAMVSCLLKLIDLISEHLSQSVAFKRLLGDSHASKSSLSAPTPICSDDLIATLVYCIPRARPQHLYSAVRYLELFGWSSVDREQSSYFTATLESAVEYILNFGERQQAAGQRPPNDVPDVADAPISAQDAQLNANSSPHCL